MASSRLPQHFIRLWQACKGLEQDSIEQLVQIVGDKDTVRQMLVSHFGRSFRHGRHILRVLYYRPLLNLLPGTALRRSETHIVRQIFSGLTSINVLDAGYSSGERRPVAALATRQCQRQDPAARVGWFDFKSAWFAPPSS